MNDAEDDRSNGRGASALRDQRGAGLGWGPYYNNHLSPYDGRPLGPPLSALPPGAEYYNGMPRAGYIVTLGPGYGPERSYAYPSAQIYRPARVVRPRHAVRHHRAMKRRVVEYRR